MAFKSNTFISHTKDGIMFLNGLGEKFSSPVYLGNSQPVESEITSYSYLGNYGVYLKYGKMFSGAPEWRNPQNLEVGRDHIWVAANGYYVGAQSSASSGTGNKGSIIAVGCGYTYSRGYAEFSAFQSSVQQLLAVYQHNCLPIAHNLSYAPNASQQHYTIRYLDPHYTGSLVDANTSPSTLLDGANSQFIIREQADGFASEFGTKAVAGAGRLIITNLKQAKWDGGDGYANLYTNEDIQVGVAYVYDPTNGHLLYELRPPEGEDDAGITQIMRSHGPGYRYPPGQWEDPYQENALFDWSTSTETSNSFFGFSADTALNRIVIGAPHRGSSGSVFIYKVLTDRADINENNWDRTGGIDSTRPPIELTSPNNHGTSNMGFGCEVAIGQGRIVVSEPGAPDGGTNRGQVHIYNLDGVFIKSLSSPTATNNDYFGGSQPSSARFGKEASSLAVGSGRIVVGAPKAAVSGTSNIGRVFVYTLDGDYIDELTRPNPSQYDYFGWGVDVADGIIAVTSHGQDFSATSNSNGQGIGAIHRYSTPNLVTPYDILAKYIGDT